MNDSIGTQNYIVRLVHNNIDEYATFKEKEGHLGQ